MERRNFGCGEKEGDDSFSDESENKETFTKEMQAEFLAKIEARERELDKLTAEANNALSKARAEAEEEKNEYWKKPKLK